MILHQHTVPFEYVFIVDDAIIRVNLNDSVYIRLCSCITTNVVRTNELTSEQVQLGLPTVE